jgi:uncharacterized membrane protein YdjX (TVP38/TMEM64 family)
MKINKKKLLNIILIVLFLAGMTIATVLLTPLITHLTGDPDQFRDYINSFGSLSVLVFIGFQILQVVVAAIPGEFVQIAGGYVFGTLWGTVYSVAGILIGACIAFFFARLLGVKVVNALVSEKNVEKFRFIINNRKAEFVIFLLLLIPGLPKDILVYVAGLSPIKPLRFFLIFIVARMPGLVGSSFIGSSVQSQNYLMAVIVFVVSCLLFFIGLFTKDLIMSKIKGSGAE